MSRRYPSLWFPSIKEYENWCFYASCCDIPLLVITDGFNAFLSTNAKSFHEKWFRIDIKTQTFQNIYKRLYLKITS